MNASKKSIYINPHTGFGFKTIFGNEKNKELLISFINSVLKGYEVIKDLICLNPNKFDTDTSNAFEYYCRNKQDEYILVEIQRGNPLSLKSNSLYYSCYPIQIQRKKDIKSIYIINVSNFIFDSSYENNYFHEVKLIDTTTKDCFYNELTFIYLEMPKFNKRENELRDMFDKWLFVLRNLSRLMSRPEALQERVFTKLFEAAEIAKFTKEQYEAYEDSLKVYRDWKNTIETAELKAEKKGRIKGKMEEKKEMAQKMLQRGFSLDDIAAITNLQLPLKNN